MNFNERVFALVRQVPRGKVVAYGDVAAAMGKPRAARQVGRALAALGRYEPEGPPVPWQRVLKKDGTLPFGGEPERWRYWRDRLAEEGVPVGDDERVDMATYRWQPAADDWLDPALDLDAAL